MKPENIKFACICPTYNRPEFLPEAIESFLRQTHRHRELIIIDDADQYEPQSGDRWRLIPFAERFPFVYDKYSFGIEALSDCHAVAIWDDDDISLPNRLSVLAEILAEGNDVAGFSAICHWGTKAAHRLTHRIYFHCGAYMMDAYRKVGGYPHVNSGGDQVLRNRFRFAGFKFEYTEEERLEYVYRWKSPYRHLSFNNKDSCDAISRKEVVKMSGKIQPFWSQDWIKVAQEALEDKQQKEMKQEA